MNQNKIIFMGRTGVGKTTLTQRLSEMELTYKKTQAIEFYDQVIDTPGEYLENRSFYRALISASADALLIALLADPTVKDNYIPPAFAATFAKEMIGIITKITLASEDEITRVEQELKEAGALHVFRIDTVEDIGTKELFEYLGTKMNLIVHS